MPDYEQGTFQETLHTTLQNRDRRTTHWRWYEAPIADGRGVAEAADMKKRVAAGAVWLYVTWYAWSVLANATALPDFLGPFLGLAVAAFVWLDPTNRIWQARPAAPSRPADSAGVPDPG
jgi:hypothetical protein